jgi:hypothetical protein
MNNQKIQSTRTSMVNQILSETSPEISTPPHHHRAVSLMPTFSPDISAFRKSTGPNANTKIVKHIRGGSKLNCYYNNKKIKINPSVEIQSFYLVVLNNLPIWTPQAKKKAPQTEQRMINHYNLIIRYIFNLFVHLSVYKMVVM